MSNAIENPHFVFLGQETVWEQKKLDNVHYAFFQVGDQIVRVDEMKHLCRLKPASTLFYRLAPREWWLERFADGSRLGFSREAARDYLFERIYACERLDSFYLRMQIEDLSRYFVSILHALDYAIEYTSVFLESTIKVPDLYTRLYYVMRMHLPYHFVKVDTHKQQGERLILVNREYKATGSAIRGLDYYQKYEEWPHLNATIPAASIKHLQEHFNLRHELGLLKLYDESCCILDSRKNIREYRTRLQYLRQYLIKEKICIPPKRPHPHCAPDWNPTQVPEAQKPIFVPRYVYEGRALFGLPFETVSAPDRY